MAEEPKLKFCKDCRWVTRKEYVDDLTSYKCTNKETGMIGLSVIDGNFVLVRCIDARDDLSPCGPYGKLWEPRK